MKKIPAILLSTFLLVSTSGVSFALDGTQSANTNDMPEILIEYADRLQQVKGVNADIDSYQQHHSNHLMDKKKALQRYEAYSADLERYYAFVNTSDSAFTDKSKLLEEKRATLKAEKDQIVKLFDDLFQDSLSLADERKVIQKKMSILYDVEKEIDEKVKLLIQKNKSIVELNDGVSATSKNNSTPSNVSIDNSTSNIPNPPILSK